MKYEFSEESDSLLIKCVDEFMEKASRDIAKMPFSVGSLGRPAPDYFEVIFDEN